MPKIRFRDAKSPKQVRYLMSDASPLGEGQKAKLKDELRSGRVTIRRK